jgi:hypothetical protein
MTVYAWPDNIVFRPQKAILRVLDNTQRVAESPLSGNVQTTSMPGARWGWDFEFQTQSNVERNAVEAFLIGLSGREHRVTLWDHSRPEPRGTINRAGVTVKTTAAQFATSVVLQGCGAGKTIMGGDWLGFPSGQIVMAVANATADGSGDMTVLFRQMLRAALPSTSAVTLVKPSARFVRSESGIDLPRWMGPVQDGFNISFVEVFA